MPQRLYVYYRVDASDLDAACRAARAMQDALRAAHPGLEAVLLRRPAGHDAAHAGEVTLMETYAAPQGIDAAMRERIEAAATALSRWQRGPRHAEVFEPFG